MILPQDPVQAAIVHALNNHSYDDAIFLSERLFAEAPTDSTLFLLATCYYQAGRKSQAYRFLKNKGYPTARCRYLYSRCCFEIGKLNEAEFALTNGTTKTRTTQEFSEEYGDNASFALSLLADVYRKTERHDKALEYYRGSLSLNPFMWSSFCHMCQLGGKPDPGQVFQSSQVTQAMNSVKSVLFSPQAQRNIFSTIENTHLKSGGTNSTSSSTPLHTSTLPLISVMSTPDDNSLASMGDLETPDMDSHLSFRTPANPISTDHKPIPAVGKLFMSESNPMRTPAMPSFGMLPLDTPLPGVCDLSTPAMISSPLQYDVPQAPAKRLTKPVSQQQSQHTGSTTAAPVGKLVFGQSSTSNTTTTTTEVMAPPPRSTFHNSIIPRRRSKRILDNQISSSVKENSKVQTRLKHTSPKSSVRRVRTTHSITKSQEDLNTKNKLNSSSQKSSAIDNSAEMLDMKQKQSAAAFLSLLREIGDAYLSLQTYDIKQAVEKFEKIPYHQYKTGWVLAELGRAYLELSEHQKAEKVFKELRSLEPHQVRGMETYSTVLFHLQEEVALSTLSQDMVAIDKTSAETWCVNGNCFSLQKEHETAIKFLQRAIQVDPTFAYAYTLLGHEYTLTEDYDKAMSAFRSALRVDTRHYNAWYGLGMIFYKKEKFTLAEAHFKKALAINPQSAVLLCHIGLVQHALQRHDVALETLNQAVALGPRNPMCLFHRASMLVANDRLDEALTELETLKGLTPKESLVYFLIGKVHKRLGNAHLSMLNFSWATDLDPKGANNHIKEAIDRRYITDEDEDPSLDTSVLLEDTPSGTLSTDTSVIMDSDEAQQQLQANESDGSL